MCSFSHVFFLVASQQWVIQLVLTWAFQICLHGGTVKIRDSNVSNKENWMLIDSFCGKAGTQLPWMPYTNLSTGSEARRHTSGCPIQAKLWWISRKLQVALLGEYTNSVIVWSRYANGKLLGDLVTPVSTSLPDCFFQCNLFNYGCANVVGHVAMWNSPAWQPHPNKP